MQGDALVFAITTIVFQAVGFYMFPFTVLAVFTGRSERVVKKTQTFMPVYMLMYPFLVFASFYALTVAPGLKGPAANSAFMAVAEDVLPGWLLGVVAGAAALAAIVVLTVASLVIGALLTRNVVRGVSEAGQRRVIQAVVLAYLVISLVLTLATPSLMLTLVNTAYFGIGQFLPGVLVVLFGGRIRPLAIAAGIVIADALAVGLYLLDVTAGGINLGLIALAVNVAVLGVSRALWPADDVPLPVSRMRRPGRPRGREAAREGEPEPVR
jgi:SSS family solute:Na+ symporter